MKGLFIGQAHKYSFFQIETLGSILLLKLQMSNFGLIGMATYYFPGSQSKLVSISF